MDGQEFLSFQRRHHLPCIHEEIYLGNHCILPAEVPDTHISLECDEIIEDWDDFDANDIYNPLKTERIHRLPLAINQELPTDKFNMFTDDFPPPNSPVSGMDNGKPVLLLQNSQYVNSLLQLWRDAPEDVQYSTDTTHLDLSDLSMEDAEESDDKSSSCQSSQSSQSNQSENSQHDEQHTDVIVENQSHNGQSGHDEHNTAMDNHDQRLQDNTHYNQELIFYTQSSSRSTSPIFVEGMNQPVNRFSSFRSISPHLMRSPSPISSRSSSPRFMRSPSPLDFIQQGLSGLPLYDMPDDIVFYDDRYIFRSRSPVGSSDHEVPDVDMEFQTFVAESEEFPSFRRYQNIRQVNSCQDQVVPEYIEE